MTLPELAFLWLCIALVAIGCWLGADYDARLGLASWLARLAERIQRWRQEIEDEQADRKRKARRMRK